MGRQRPPSDEGPANGLGTPPARHSALHTLLLLLLAVVVILLLLPPQLSAQPLLQPNPQKTQLRPQRASNIGPRSPTGHPLNEAASPRQRRQSKPRESIWQLYFRLMSEGNNDTVSAFQQIRQLFSTLIEAEKPQENLSLAVNSTLAAEAGGEDDAVGAGMANGNVTTTTTEPTPRKISTSELMGIFQRNVFGLGRLFGREFWNAIQQSNKNIEMYTKEWQEAIRPFVE